MSLFFSVVPFLFSLFLAVFPGIETKVRRKKKTGKRREGGKEGKSIYVCVCMNVMRMMPPVMSGRPGISCLPPPLYVPKLRSIINRSNREKCGPKHAAACCSIRRKHGPNSDRSVCDAIFLFPFLSLMMCAALKQQKYNCKRRRGGTERQQVDLT